MSNNDSSSQMSTHEFSTQQNQSANIVPSEPPPIFNLFAAEQDNLFPFLPPLTPISNSFKDIVSSLVEEANVPSQYNNYSGLDLYTMSCNDDLYIPLFESSYAPLPPLSPVNSFEDTSSIILPPSPDRPAANAQNIASNDNNNDAILPPPILPSTTEIMVSPGSSTMVDDTCTKAIASTSKDSHPNNTMQVEPSPTQGESIFDTVVLPPNTLLAPDLPLVDAPSGNSCSFSHSVDLFDNSDAMVDDTYTKAIATTSKDPHPNNTMQVELEPSPAQGQTISDTVVLPPITLLAPDLPLADAPSGNSCNLSHSVDLFDNSDAIVDDTCTKAIATTSKDPNPNAMQVEPSRVQGQSISDTVVLPPNTLLAPDLPLADASSGNLCNLSHFDNSDAKLTPSVLPSTVETVSATPISPNSTPIMVDDTCIGAITITSSENRHLSMVGEADTANVTITNEIAAIESVIKKQRRPKKIRRVISSGEAARSSHCFQEEATMDVLNVLLGLAGSKKNTLKPLTLRVDRDEDVAEKIISFAKEKGPVFSIVGAVGALSVIQLLHKGNTTTFKGNFEIISLYGTSLFPKEGDHRMEISLTVVDIDDGEIFGGTVQGKLVAATSIQMVGLTIPPTGYKLRRLKTKLKVPKHRLQPTSVEEEEHQSNDDAILEELNTDTTKADGTKVDEALAEDMNVKLQLRPQLPGDVSMEDVIQNQVH